MRKTTVILVIVSSLALGLALIHAGLTSAVSSNLVLVSKQVEKAREDAWKTAPAVLVPLSAQTVTKPRGGGSVREAALQSFHDGTTIYFRLQWHDETKDDLTVAHEQYRDGAAIQFPVEPGRPYFLCMGATHNRLLNIWHWKADWQRELDTGGVATTDFYKNSYANLYQFEMMKGEKEKSDFERAWGAGRDAGNILSLAKRTTPIEELLAGGIGSITTHAIQSVQGKGTYDAETKQWTVVFWRTLKPQVKNQAVLNAQPNALAIAVWNGSAGERDGMKSISNWIDLELETRK